MDKTISIEKLRELSLALKFDMSDEEYVKLQNDFETLLKQMDLINQTISTDGVENMDFPFPVVSFYLRDDDIIEDYPRDEILKNAKTIEDGQIKVSKVVE